MSRKLAAWLPQEFELRGASKIEDAHTFGIVCALMVLSYLDLGAPEAEPIVALLRGIPSALQFVLDNNLSHFRSPGLTSRSAATTLASLAFGKDEDGGFSFTHQMINDVLAQLGDTITGHIRPFFPVLPPHFVRPALHLCISGTPPFLKAVCNGCERLCVCWAADTNKALLVQSAGLIPLLIDSCFWAENHPRKDADDLEKAPIQNDALDALLQIALFKPGRELLQSNTTVMGMLAAMADGMALTEEGKLSARNALVAIKGVTREPEPEVEGRLDSDKHVMVSYQVSMCCFRLSASTHSF